MQIGAPASSQLIEILSKVTLALMKSTNSSMILSSAEKVFNDILMNIM
jgi:hypothetical protein